MVSCLSSVSLLVQIPSSLLKTRTFLGCSLVFPQLQHLLLTYRPIAEAELNNSIPNGSSAGFSKDSFGFAVIRHSPALLDFSSHFRNR